MANRKTAGLRQIAGLTAAGRDFMLGPDDDWRTDIPAMDGDEEDAGAGARSESTARQRVASHVIRKLNAADFATFTTLRGLIPTETQKLLPGGHRLCIVARLPSVDWIGPARGAFEATLVDLVADLDTDFDLSVSVLGLDERRFGGGGFDVTEVVRALTRSHLLIPLLPGENLDGVLLALADLEVDLTPTQEALSLAVSRRHAGAVWPEGIDPLHVRPDDLDLALQRSATPGHAFVLLEKIASASAAAEERHAKSEKEDAARKADEAASRKARQPTSTAILRPTEPRLEDLHGYGVAAAWAQDLVRDLHDYRDGKLGWQDVDAGCLLYGPPGTGKTMFASALAASAGLPFVATSYADWQSQGDGHLGYVVKCLRRRFADGEANAPAILFIDEIDVVGRRGGGRDHDGWWSAIITALLEALDGTLRREGLVVIAACNDASRLDPALIRSGRLDRRFEIGLPDEASLARIFAHHLPDGDVGAFEQVATVLAGTTSGADVSRIAREARRVARRAGRTIEAEDLLAIAMPADQRSDRDRRLVAVHEAGHAVAIMSTGGVPDSLSLVNSAGTHGGVTADRGFGMRRVSEVEGQIIRMLAGRAAEEVILGEPSGGAVGDLTAATSVVSRMIGTHGLGGRLATADEVPLTEVEARIQSLYGRALRLIGEHRGAVESLAAIALDRRVLGKRALAEFARDHGFGGGR